VSYEGEVRNGEKCVYHPGVPIFHEGSKGYTCCKRKVLEFDEFMKIEGCKTKDRHLFVGSGKKKGISDGGEEVLETVRYVNSIQFSQNGRAKDLRDLLLMNELYLDTIFTKRPRQ
jgi:hypothetical protein